MELIIRTVIAWTSEIESKHGRIEQRELHIEPFDKDLALFPGARQLTRYDIHWHASPSSIT